MAVGLIADDRKDGVFQAGMFGLIALDLVITYGANVWHLLQPAG